MPAPTACACRVSTDRIFGSITALLAPSPPFAPYAGGSERLAAVAAATSDIEATEVAVVVGAMEPGEEEAASKAPGSSFRCSKKEKPASRS